MSFRDPPRKDKELLDDGWSQSQQFVPPPPPPPPSPPRANPWVSAPGQPLSPPPQMPVGPYAPHQAYGARIVDSSRQPHFRPGGIDTVSFTEEDLRFMNRLQSDAFFKRTLPLGVVVTLGYAYYRRRMNLPIKVWPILLAYPFCMIAGTLSYRNEFRRRLSENPSISPGMLQIKAYLGLPPPINAIDNMNAGYQGQSSWGQPTYNAVNPEAPTFTPYTLNPQPHQPGLAPTIENQSDQLSDPKSRQGVTYDDLRARNRGFRS